jgi:hypothetical protein
LQHLVSDFNIRLSVLHTLVQCARHIITLFPPEVKRGTATEVSCICYSVSSAVVDFVIGPTPQTESHIFLLPSFIIQGEHKNIP